MFDTNALAQTFSRAPDLEILRQIGWKPLRNNYSDEVRALCFNPVKDETNPRLTLSQNPKGFWIIRAEVSIPEWLKGSNLCLPDEKDIKIYLCRLSEYVEINSGIVFNAHSARVTRIDFTKDFQVDESFVLPIISKFGKLTIPRYKRLCFDDSSVYFRNAGKRKTKTYLLYSKFHERLANSKDEWEQESAKGIIRLENSFRKAGVYRLAKSFKLKDHTAKNILTMETAQKAIEMAEKRLNFARLFTPNKASIEKLFEVCDSPSALNRIGYLFMKDNYGENFAELPFVDLSKRTVKRYFDDCRKAGLLSLE